MRGKASMIALTRRDLSLLDLLSRHALLSFGQIQRLVFSGRNHSTVQNRLKKIETAGFLTRQRVNRIRHPMFSGEVGVVFQITLRGVLELQKINPARTLPGKVPLLHGRQIDHDLIIVETAEKLKPAMPGSEYVGGSCWEVTNPGDPRPDGVFRNPMTGAATAIEVELSLKSADRYREIITAYRVRGRFEKVIYFVGSVAIGKRIASEIKGYNVTDLEKFMDRLFEIRLLEPAGTVPPRNDEMTIRSVA